MNPKCIPRLLSRLKSVPSSSTVANPYTSPECSKNLTAYLQALCALPYSGHLLVGEAPGHRGCALTGIPFTSQSVLKNSGHRFIRQLRPLLRVSGGATEATATIVWGHLESGRTLPALWNIFPFHPHKTANPESNRSPSHVEVLSGQAFVQLMIDVLTPNRIIAIGRTAAKALARLFPGMEIVSVRHPSFGGKADFISGIEAAGVR